MPNSLRCKIKHLYHNGTLTERERDRILKTLEQEPCDKCEVGNPCLYCKHEFELQESAEDDLENLDSMLEDLWNATEEDHRKYSEVEAFSSNFIQLKQDVLNNKQLWRKLREIEDEDSD